MAALEAAAPPAAPREPEQLSDDESDPENAYDILESELCGEYSHAPGSAAPGPAMSQRTRNDVGRAQLAAHRAAREKGREDRATTEQVLDPRTRLILHKLLQRGAFAKLEGCLSTGKEANVYYATAGATISEIAPGVEEGAELAVKVYKTSILVFRDRQRYVDGEHRFRRGYTGGKNPRKMVQLWAEKELRNYKRLQRAGVPAPTPVLLKGHVLAMAFVGTGGWPAPRLHEARLDEAQVRDAYWQTCRATRVMYWRCRLVHGDLSEYNLLWKDNTVVVIDVSQSVEHDHPRATEFLRKDCQNVNAFFGKTCGYPVDALTTKELYDFVVDDSDAAETDDLVDASLQRALDAHTARGADAAAADDAVFLESFLPRSLADLGDNPERAQRTVEGGTNEAAFDDAVRGLLGGDAASTASERGGFTDESSSSSDEEAVPSRGRLPHAAEDRAKAKELKRAAAKAQKEQAAERRKTKVKKHVKKKATKHHKK